MLFDLATESDVPLIVNLSKEAVSDQLFLISLLRPRAEASDNNQMESIYESIHKHLIVKSHGKQTIRESHKLQSWGTCSYDSIAAFLEYKLPPSIFIPFHFDMILRARWALNSLIPQGKIDRIYDQNTRYILDYIDAKSCETVAAQKKKFDQLCTEFKDFDLYLAHHLIGHYKIETEDRLKSTLESFSDLAFTYGTWRSIDLMRGVEEIVEKISPEQMQIIRNRKQGLAPNKIFPNPNHPTLSNLNFQHVLNYTIRKK